MEKAQKHLERLSKKELICDDHINHLKKLKKSGVEPKVIYDIGSCVLHWTRAAQKIWPDAKVYLFDAFTTAEFLYKDYEYHIGVLSDIDNKIVKFYQNDEFPTGNSYYKEIGHTKSAKNNARILFNESHMTERVAMTLDTVVNQKGFPKPDLVKIDVQGSEKDVVAGGKSTLKNASHLIVEMQHAEYNKGAPLVTETLPFIEKTLDVVCTAPLFANNGPDGDYCFESKDWRSKCH